MTTVLRYSEFDAGYVSVGTPSLAHVGAPVAPSAVLRDTLPVNVDFSQPPQSTPYAQQSLILTIGYTHPFSLQNVAD